MPNSHSSIPPDFHAGVSYLALIHTTHAASSSSHERSRTLHGSVRGHPVGQMWHYVACRAQRRDTLCELILRSVLTTLAYDSTTCITLVMVSSGPK